MGKSQKFVTKDLHQCCLCNDSHSDYTVVTTKTREGAGLWEKCNICDLVINRSGVSKDEFDEFYNKTYFEKNSYKKGKILTAEQHFNQRKNSIQGSFENFKKYLEPAMNVLEIGSGAGELIFAVKKFVNSCSAIEMNKEYVEFMNKSLGVSAASKDYATADIDSKLDMIIIVNTIDHMMNTLGVLKKIHHDLKDDGLIYIEVPNDQQALATLLPAEKSEKFRNFMYQKAHYYSFTFETLEKTLEWAGFKVIEKNSKHDYTINNFLNWCIAGSRQVENKQAKEETDILAGENPFAVELNAMFKELNLKFKESISRNLVGESICMVAKKI